jgi:hypothetical protein
MKKKNLQRLKVGSPPLTEQLAHLPVQLVVGVVGRELLRQLPLETVHLVLTGLQTPPRPGNTERINQNLIDHLIDHLIDNQLII